MAITATPRPWSRTNRLIVDAAERLGVEALPLGSEASDFFMRLRWPDAPEGPRSVLISKTRSPFLTQVAQTLANHKFLSRERLAAHGLPVVAGLLLDEASDPSEEPRAAARAREFLAAHGRLVAKPNWGNRGIGVLTGIEDFTGLVAAYRHASARDRDEEALFEPELPGTNLRVAIIGGRYEGAVEIRRPRLRGDGRHSARERIAALNRDPRRGSWRRPSLVTFDEIELTLVEDRLAAVGLGLDDPLPPGFELELCFEESEVIDRSEDLDGRWVEVCVAAARLLAIDVAGVDLRGPLACFIADGPVCDGPLPEGPARLLEVNALPALHLHALPTEGQPRPVFEAFVAYCLQLPGAPPPRATLSPG